MPASRSENRVLSGDLLRSPPLQAEHICRVGCHVRSLPVAGAFAPREQRLPALHQLMTSASSPCAPVTEGGGSRRHWAWAAVRHPLLS